MLTLPASYPRLLLIKSGPGSGAKIAHSGKHALYGTPPRWHLVTPDKPAPKGAPIAAHPHAAGQHAPAEHFTADQWEALKLPDSNVNAPVFNKALAKLKDWSDAGNVTAILGAKFGTNTYAKKLVTIANHLLGLHGSPHKVTAGQQPGEHAAVQSTPADPHPSGLPEHLAPKAEPAPTDSAHVEGAKWVMPIKDAIAEHQELVAAAESPSKADDKEQLTEQKVELGKMQAAAGKLGAAQGSGVDAKALQEKLETLHDFLSTSPNSPNAQAWKAKIAEIEAQIGPLKSAEPAKAEKPAVDTAKWSEPHKAAYALKQEYAKLDKLNTKAVGAFKIKLRALAKKTPEDDGGAVLLIDGMVNNLWGTDYNPKVAGIELAPAAAQPASAAATGPKEGDTKPAADGGTLVLKDGHWVKQGDPAPTGNLSMPDFQEGKTTAGVKALYEKTAQKLMDHAHAGNLSVVEGMLDPDKKMWQGKTANSKKLVALHAEAVASLKGAGVPGIDPTAPAPAAEPAAAPAGGSKLSQIPWAQQMLPTSNTNAASHNKAVSKIKAMAETGDMAGLQAFADSKAGAKQGYAKKQGLLAQLALAALKEGDGPVPAAAPVPAAEPPQAAPAPKPEAAPQPAVPAADTGALSADQLGKLQSIPWFKQKLPDSNTNAKSHNAAVAKIEAMAFAGDKAGLQSFIDAKAGAKQSYAKKQHLLAVSALAALQDDAVSPGDLAEAKANAKEAAALQGPTVNTPVPADVKKTIDGMAAKGDKGALEAVAANNPNNPHVAAYAQKKLDEMAATARKLTEKEKAGLIKWMIAGKPTNSHPDSWSNLWKKLSKEQKAEATKAFDDFQSKPAPAAPVAPPIAGKPAYDHLAQQLKAGASASETAEKWIEANPGQFDELNEALTSLGFQFLATYWQAPVSPPALSAKGGAPAPVTADTPLGRKQLEALEAFSPGELKALQDGKHLLPPNVAAWIDKKLAEPEKPAVPAKIKVSTTLFENTLDGHNKFWSVSSHGNVMKTEYGAIGTKGVSKEKTFSTPEAAKVAAAKLIKQKQSKGYQLKGWTDHEYDAPAGAPPVEQGPKDGDTKPGADGMLVFKDGRWHKQVGAAPAGKPQKPQLTGFVDVVNEIEGYIDQGNSEKLADAITSLTGLHSKNAKAAMAYAQAGQAYLAGAAPNTSWGYDKGDPAMNGHPTLTSDHGMLAWNADDSQAEYHWDGMDYVNDEPLMALSLSELLQQMADNGFPLPSLADVQKLDPNFTASGMPGAKKPAQAASGSVVGGLPSMDAWVQTGGQGGSNPGGKFKDPSGQEWYCKFPTDADAAKSEVLAAKLYALAGLSGQDAILVTKGGKIGIASKWTDIKKASSAAALAQVDGVHSGFAVDAWLGNWDVIGLSLDNTQIGPDGKAHRVDAGGSLEYRAQGEKKPFGDKVDEIDTLRDPKKNPQSAAVFGKLTAADITASVAKVATISDAQIRAMVFEQGPGDEAAKKKLADTLIARKNDLLARFPKAAKPAKKALDPSALPVDPASIPKPHDFENWNGPGKGLSSKDYVNKANAVVEYQMMALAQAGNMTALQSFQFTEVNKDTGAPTGKMVPVSKHPSKHVQQYQQDLLQVLDEVANPPEPLKVFRETDVGSVDSLAAAFPPKKFGTTVAKVSSNEKLGFWVALGAVANPLKFAPKAVSNYTTKAVADAKAKYATASKLAKHFISSVQASGSYNDLFRDGKTHDSSGNSLQDVAQAALAHATEMPEGTSVYRWQKMSPQMLQHIMSAKDGTVFQATGPMCTSYDPTATSGFGAHRVVVRYAKGAKAVESFGSGSFKNEKEVTTLPNARFVILSKKMVPDVEHGNPNAERLELEILMLPPDLGL